MYFAALAAETTPMTMASLLETISSVFTSAINWVGTVASTIADTPLLLIGVVIGFVGLGVGLFRRMLRV